MSATQKDIANKLNISRSLVAGVLTGRNGVWASQETRHRILTTAHEMNYRPNAAARSLRTGKTNTVGLVYQCPRDQATRDHYSGVVETIAEVAGTLGYRLMIGMHSGAEELMSALREMATTRVADMFILWGEEQDVEEQGELLERLKVPFIVKGRHEIRHPDWPQIEFDHEALMDSSVRCLADQNHQRIAYMGFGGDAYYRQCLFDGYKSAMRAVFGRDADESLIAHLPSDSIDDAYRQMAQWLTLPEDQQPTALVVGANNNAWLGTEIALHDIGRKIGFGSNEFGVAGMGWGEDFLYAGHGMKTEDVSSISLARTFGERLMLPLLKGETLDSPIVRLVPPLKLVGPKQPDPYYQPRAAHDTSNCTLLHQGEY